LNAWITAVATSAGTVGVTVTVAVAPELPAALLQVKVKEVVALRAPDASVPELGRDPDQPPDASQLAAAVDDHDSCADCPAVIEVGFAVNVTVGGGLATQDTITFDTLPLLVPLPLATVHVWFAGCVRTDTL